MELLLQFLIIAYAGTGIVATTGYIPTIIDLLIHKKKSANISSYVIWTFCSLITFLYALFILQDFLVRVVTGLNFLCCAVVLILGIRLNIKYKNN
ncbi:MAG: hypothetical protein WC511_06825 [Candidatus Pacearchaeota archaeon]|jgi:hypothetical protein